MDEVELDPDIAIKVKGLARASEMLLGLWLFTSAFLWSNPDVQELDMWIFGLIVIAVSVSACVWSFLRFVNTAIAMWIFASVFALPHLDQGGTLSNVLTAIALFACSLAPTSAGPIVKQRPW